jgi:hypothetical protein
VVSPTQVTQEFISELNVHCGITKSYTDLPKRNFAVHEQRFMNLMLVTVLMSDLLYLKWDS